MILTSITNESHPRFLASAPRYAFIKSELSKFDTRTTSLLRAACHLVGSQSCQPSEEQDGGLYEQLKKKLSLVMLNPPLDNADLWAMLVLSTWNLGPAHSNSFIDSWLLSGSTLLYSSLSYGFSTSRGAIDNFDSQSLTTKDHILAWNATALLHLKSVL